MSDPVSPLAAAGQTTSLLEKLLTIRYRERRERFTEIIDPLFKEFQLIHNHYTKLLSAYEPSLPIKRTGGIAIIRIIRQADWYTSSLRA